MLLVQLKIFKHIYLKDRILERERKGEIDLLITSTKHVWASLKPGAKDSIHVSTWVEETQVIEPFLTVFPGILAECQIGSEIGGN